MAFRSSCWARSWCWIQKKSLGYIPSPLLYGGERYAVRSGGILTSFDPANGDVHKRGRLNGALGKYYPSLVAADGKIYAASNEGKLAVLSAGAQWKLSSVGDLDETIDATPAIANGRIFVRTRSTLYAFAETTNEVRPTGNSESP